MGIFSPVKRHANEFRYIPRYYDPEKERREQRRKELRGTSSQDEGEYTPGQYIRTQRDARRLAKRSSGGRRKGTPTILFLALFAVVAIVLYMLYPSIIAMFSSSRPTAEQRMEQEYKEFNPHAPIIIVPNDYKEE